MLCCSENCDRKEQCALFYRNPQPESRKYDNVENLASFGTGSISSDGLTIQYWCGPFVNYAMFEPKEGTKMANHMLEVAKMLGVEIGEEFEVFDGSKKYLGTFKLSSGGGLERQFNYNVFVPAGSDQYILTELLTGDYTIKRNPWRPKDGEKYWCVELDGSICYGYMSISAWDLNYYKLGNCYRTSEEAEANREKWVDFYNSDEVLEV